MVLNSLLKVREPFVKTCFRPLTGIMVLNSTPYKWHNYAIENGVCGADFILKVTELSLSSVTSFLGYLTDTEISFHTEE